MLKSDIPILSAQQIAEAIDRTESILEIPEWGGAIKLKAWSLEQRDLIMSMASDSGRVDGKIDPAKFVHLLVIYGVQEPPLTEASIKDKAPAIIDRIATEVMRLNGMTKEAALSASMTFRQESGPAVPVPAGEGPGQNGSAGEG
jgi:hypothetical protein